MGWLCLAAIGQMLAVLPVWVLSWPLAGSVIYTLGAIVYINKIFNFVPGVFGFHEMWHFFVGSRGAFHGRGGRGIRVIIISLLQYLD